MAERSIRRIDVTAAYGRWIALAGVLLVTWIGLPIDRHVNARLILIITAAMAVIDVAPVLMLRFRVFSDSAALAFSIVDSVYALCMLYLGGDVMFFYCFVPAVTLGVRFDWGTGLVDAALLAVGNVLIALIEPSGGEFGAVFLPALFQSLSLLPASLLGGFMAEDLKREPPLPNTEARALHEELKRLRSAADRSHAIYEMAAMLGATLHPDRILEAVLEISAVGFDELTSEDPSQSREGPASAIFLFGPDGMYVATARNIGREEAKLTVSGDSGVLYEVLSKAEPVIVGNLAGDRELRQFAPFRRCRSGICVPLRAGFELYGAVLFASPRPKAFSDEHVELLTAVSNQAAVALNNAQLYRDIQEEKEKILEVAERERSKLARDLHDGPTQSISAIAMRLNFSRLLLDREPDKVRDELFKLENLARRTTKEIRTMLFTLRPVVLETQGLKAAVEQLVERLQETGDLAVTFEIDDVEEQIDVSVKAVAWFITEEALNNAKKHAEATDIWVRMFIRDDHFIAEIEDDGVGFDYDATMADYDQRGSFGLLNYRERADLVNGRSVVRSVLGKGTKVTLMVPLNPEVI